MNRKNEQKFSRESGDGARVKNVVTRRQVEEFLYQEADLLDSWRLEEWFSLFTEDGRYLVPSGDLPDDASPDTNLFYIADDIVLLRERVKRLYKRNAHAEWPHSKTRHFIGNVRLLSSDASGEIAVRCAFLTHRCRAGDVQTFVGSSRYLLLSSEHGFRIREKRCTLDFENLHEQGRISVLL